MSTQAFFMLEVDGDERKKAADIIQKMIFGAGMIHFVAETLGPWDLIVHAEADNNSALTGTIRSALENVKGVTNIATYLLDGIHYVH